MVDTDRIVGGAKELGGKIQGAAGDFVGSHRDSAEGRFREAQGAAQDVYGQAKDRLRDAADTAGDAYGQARSRIRDVADNVTDYAADAYDRRGDYLRDGREAVSSRVEENPLIALVLAGAVGYGLALLLHGRR